VIGKNITNKSTNWLKMVRIEENLDTLYRRYRNIVNTLTGSYVIYWHQIFWGVLDLEGLCDL
jgi:hypothetical protein